MEMVEEGQNLVKIAPKLINFQEIVEKGDEDRISALPENLLIEILSRLPYTKDAIRTGTLSKRWKHLWTLVPTLSFTNTDCDRPLSNFFSFVDKALTQCRQLKLKKFEVFTPYDIGFESQINNWIRYAVSCNVEDLRLTLWSWKAELVLDNFFFTSSSFTDLRLSGGYMLNPSGAISWKNLRSLRIDSEKLDEVVIENILSGSPVLETLVLNDCYGFKRLDITSKSVKNLVFSGYQSFKGKYDEVDDIIRINAPNILSLKIEGVLELWKLLLLNVSSLVEADLDYELMNYMKRIPKEVKDETLKGFILNLRHVKELNIGVHCSINVLSRLVAKGFTIPSNVKPPDVTYDRPDSDLDLSDSDSVENEDL